MNPYIVADGDSVETAGLEKSGIAGTEKEGDNEDKKEEDKVNITVGQKQDRIRTETRQKHGTSSIACIEKEGDNEDKKEEDKVNITMDRNRTGSGQKEDKTWYA